MFLCDHNSMIFPTKDVSNPGTSPKMPDIVEARQRGLHFITDQKLVDVYDCMHDGLMDDFPLEG